MSPACHISLLTPAARGAIATVAIEGPEAEALVGRCFAARSGVPVCDLPPGRIVLGEWRGARAEATQHAGEEVVLCRKAAGEVQVHCHGGRAAAGRILADLAACGGVERSWQERARVQAADPLQAEAEIALAEALTQRTALILLDQYHGALTRARQAIAADLDAGRIEVARTALARLLALADLGGHLTRPWRVVLAGKPNAGKSSLLNALVGYERSIVYEQPGTTRDVLTALTAFNGWPVELIDTAGLRDSDDAIEREGVTRAERAVAEADLVLWIVDGSEPLTREADLALPSNRRVLLVRSKCDLPAAAPLPPDALPTSVRTGEGLAELTAAIVAALVPQAPAPGEAVPFTESQVATALTLELLSKGDRHLATMCKQAASDPSARSQSPFETSSSPRRS